MKKYNIGIIGCGLIGKKRADSLKNFGNIKIVYCCDINLESSKKLATDYNCEFTDDYTKVTNDERINIVMISTTHNKLAEIAIDAIKNKKHVLLEKPAGRNPNEIKKIVEAYESMNKKFKIKVGFNHRFHPGIIKAKELIEKNPSLANIMFIRGRYGHGGRIGYDKEWRSKKEISGGGEMLDQGSHLIDLSRYFLGDFEEVKSFSGTYFWDMEVEDNCFALLKTRNNQIASIHASWTEWKNLFCFEIMFKTGKITIDGLGKSYGKETVTFHKMKPEMGPPDTEIFTFEEVDLSWEKEFENLIYSIEQDIEPNGNIYDAYESIKLVYKTYEEEN